MSSLKQKLNQRVNREIYRLNGQAASLNGLPVFPIIESNSDQEEGAAFVPLTAILFTARFNAFTIIDDDIKLASGQTLTLDTPFAGHSEFRLITDPVPTGRKSTQFMVSIAPTRPTSIGATS